MESQLPLKFCSKANEEAPVENQDISACDYMAFAVIDTNYETKYICAGDENIVQVKSTPPAKGMGRMTRSLIDVGAPPVTPNPGVVIGASMTRPDPIDPPGATPSSKIMVHKQYTDKCLFRFQFASASGHLIFFDQEKTSFWAIDPETRVLQAVNDENSATAFEMFRSVHTDAILLRGGPFFLSIVGSRSAPSAEPTTTAAPVAEPSASVSPVTPTTPGSPTSIPPTTPGSPASVPPTTPDAAPPVSRLLDTPASPPLPKPVVKKLNVYALLGSPSFYIFASNAITNAAYLLPPKSVQAIDNKTALSSTVDAIEARVLGYRLQYLQSSRKLLSSTWMAYDLSLLVLLKRPFNVFQISGAKTWDLAAAFRKAVALITEKMLPQYTEMYPSLGKGFSKAFSVYAIASSTTVVVENPQVWQEVASEYVKILNDKDDLAMHVGATVFAQAMMQDAEEKTSFFTASSLSVPEVMAVYYRSSCALAFIRTDLPLLDRLNLVQFLTNRFKKFREELALPAEPIGTYWFSSLLNSERFGIDTSDILIDLGLLRALDPIFLAEKTNVGDRISNKIFLQINDVLQSSNGIDIRRISELVESFDYDEVTMIIDQICMTEKLRIELCVLPLLFRQIQNMRGSQNNLLSSNTTTDLTIGEYNNYEEYLQLVVEDKRHLQIGLELAKTIDQFNNLTFEIGKDISNTIAETTVATITENSKNMAKTVQLLNQYLSSESKFRVQAFNSRMIQKLNIIYTRGAKVKVLVKPFLEKIRRIALFAMARAAVDLAVNMIFMVFQIVDLAASFRKGGPKDIGTIGGVVGTARDLLASLKTMSDTLGLIEILIALSTQLIELGVKVQQVMPKMMKIRGAAETLTDISGRNMSIAERQAAAESFLNAVKDYRPPLTLAEINSLEKQLTAIARKMCVVSQTAASNDCVTAPADATGLFGHIDGILFLTDEAMQILYQHTLEAINARTRSLLQDTAEENEAQVGKAEPTGNEVKEERVEAFQRQIREQRYKNSVAIVATLLNQFQITSALINKCNREAYMNGGLPTTLCQQALYSGNPVADETLLKIMTSRARSNEPTIVRNTATIPTMPSSPDDLAYIDLAKLSMGEAHYFQLSTNVSWLMSNNWIQQESEMTNYVSYLTKLRIKLPLLLDNCLTEQCQMTITLQSMPISDLGPSMKNKKYRLSPRTYKTEFDQVSSDTQKKSTACESVEYQNCDSRYPQYCFRSHGVSDASASKGLHPSMFSQFAMIAEVETSGDSKPRAIPYQLEATPFSVYVDYEAIRYPVRADADSEDIARMRSRRLKLSRPGPKASNPIPSASNPTSGAFNPRPSVSNPTSSASGRCCPKGEYLRNSNSEQNCSPCQPGTFSRYGGLYCARST